MLQYTMSPPGAPEVFLKFVLNDHFLYVLVSFVEIRGKIFTTNYQSAIFATLSFLFPRLLMQSCNTPMQNPYI